MTQATSQPGMRCPWCGQPITTATGNCPRCGAALAVAPRVDQSGFEQRPAIADMARLQFGASTCQIEGESVPVADFHLAADDFIYFSHHRLLWTDPAITLRGKSLQGGWQRMVGGMPVFLTEAVGPGHMALSADEPGETIALPLDVGHAVDIQESHFLAATSSIALALVPTLVWIKSLKAGSNDEQEMMMPLGNYFDRFVAEKKPGIVFLHCRGNCFVQNLAAGQAILIKPTAFLYKDPAVEMNLHIQYVSLPGFIHHQKIARLWLRITGPGRIAVQSAYEPIEPISGPIMNSSGASWEGP